MRYKFNPLRLTEAPGHPSNAVVPGGDPSPWPSPFPLWSQCFRACRGRTLILLHLDEIYDAMYDHWVSGNSGCFLIFVSNGFFFLIMTLCLIIFRPQISGIETASWKFLLQLFSSFLVLFVAFPLSWADTFPLQRSRRTWSAVDFLRNTTCLYMIFLRNMAYIMFIGFCFWILIVVFWIFIMTNSWLLPIFFREDVFAMNAGWFEK